MQIDYNSLEEVVKKLRYHESLLSFLDDMVPCLDELISQFDEDQE